jgi:hypothetical protein
VAQVNVDAQYKGRTCDVVAVAKNNSSVHPGNDLRVFSDNGSSVTLRDVERAGGVETKAEGKILLGNKLTVEISKVGASKTFSGGMEAKFYCPEPEPKPVKLVCPIKPAQGLTIVNLEGRLYSDRTPGNQTAAQAVNLPKGTYTVRLVGWDGYIGRENMTQPKEAYKLVLTGNNYTVSTNAHSDLKDKVREASVDEVVHNANFVVEKDVTSVYAAHAFYLDKSSPNSLEPICASFERIPDPEPLVCDSLQMKKLPIERSKLLLSTRATMAHSRVLSSTLVMAVTQLLPIKLVLSTLLQKTEATTLKLKSTTR